MLICVGYLCDKNKQSCLALSRASILSSLPVHCAHAGVISLTETPVSAEIFLLLFPS